MLLVLRPSKQRVRFDEDGGWGTCCTHLSAGFSALFAIFNQSFSPSISLTVKWNLSIESTLLNVLCIMLVSKWVRVRHQNGLSFLNGMNSFFFILFWMLAIDSNINWILFFYSSLYSSFHYCLIRYLLFYYKILTFSKLCC